MRASVDLPQPDWPTMPSTSPAGRLRLTPSTAETVAGWMRDPVGKRRTRPDAPSTVSRAGGAAGAAGVEEAGGTEPLLPAPVPGSGNEFTGDLLRSEAGDPSAGDGVGEGRSGGRTRGHSEVAARVEAASRWYAGEARWRAGDGQQVRTALGGLRHRAQKCLGVWVRGMREYGVGVAAFDNSSRVHDGHVVRDLHHDTE